MSRKVHETKELVKVKKRSGGKKLFKFITFAFTVSAIANAVSKLADMINIVNNDSEKNGDILKYSMIFNGRNIKIENKPFKGAIINNICSGIKLDLGSSIIEKDVNIHCKSLMSGISIIVPEKVKVVVSGKSIMSGVANNVPKYEDATAPTIHIYADHVMSGIEVKIKEQSSDVVYSESLEEDTEE